MKDFDNKAIFFTKSTSTSKVLMRLASMTYMKLPIAQISSLETDIIESTFPDVKKFPFLYFIKDSKKLSGGKV
jgi:hypothetical protein